MSFCPNDDFSSEPLSITIQNENWRGNINRAIAIGQSLLSLTTIIQNVHSVVLNGEGDELYQRMMKMENNENIVDEIVWKLLKMQENVAEKLSEMKIAAGPIWRWVTVGREFKDYISALRSQSLLRFSLRFQYL